MLKKDPGMVLLMSEKIDTDRAVRAYLLALREGVMPEHRPADCGSWANIVCELVERFEKYHGDAGAMARLFAVYERQYPQLADLLSSSSASCLVVPERDSGMPELPVEARLPPDASRGACAWLDRYEQFSKEASPEGYEQYHVFCGLWLLSTVAARRVYLPLQRKRITTNLMIALYGTSSVYAKSTTAEVALDVLSAAGLEYLLTPRRITPSKLLSDMAGYFDVAAYDKASPAGQRRMEQKLAMAGQRGMYFDEFGKFVQSMLRKNSTNAEYMSIFLELDGCPDHFDTSTISRGAETIEKPYLSLLGLMVPANLKDNARSGADFWTDGFWGRFSFVAAPPGPGSDATLDLGDLPIPSELIAPLVAWHERLGVPECEMEPIFDKKGEPSGKYESRCTALPETEARMSQLAYDAYKRYRSALKRLFQAFEHEDFNASYARLPETALRMALLMASLENNNRIELRHWARAQELAELLRQSLHEIYMQVNAPQEVESEDAKLEDAILRHLKRVGPLTLNALRTSYMKNYSTKQLESMLSQLMKYGKVESFATSHATKYKLIEEPQEDIEP